MDARPKLPYDVLLIIAALADRKPLLALITTCRTLHRDCAKYVLQDPVVLRDDRNITSFIYFMRPHKRKRWWHLRSLRLLGERISPHVAEALARVIPRASRLESLVFRHAEKTLGAHPDLPLAFAAIRTVKHLVVDHGYQHTCRMLEAMHWPLESAVLNYSDFKANWQDPDVLSRMHPAALLKNARTTLKRLECESWCECSDTLDTYPVYPKLESLYLEGVWCPRAAQWPITYPSLKQLSVHTIDSHFMAEDEDDIAGHDANRLLNLNQYKTLPQKWNELEQFSGDALDLYLLGLTCRIRDLNLSLCSDSLQFFAPVMATARPTRLRLSITTTLFTQPVPTYLQDPGLADLKSLELHVVTWVGGIDGRGDTDVDRFLGHVLDALRRASARELIFSLTVEKYSSRAHPILSSSPEPDGPDEQTGPPNRPARAIETPPLSAVESWANDTDLDALVHRFLEEVPSMELVKISVQPRLTDTGFKPRSAEVSRGRDHRVEPKDMPLAAS